MRAFLTSLLIFCAGAARAQAPISRCWAACERNVADPRARASACGACLTSPDRADAWLARLPSQPPNLLADPDWEVRWAALLVDARKVKGTGTQQLGKWLARARGDELLRACVTAVHAAGTLKQPLTTLVPGKSRCDAKAVEQALWLELYGESVPLRAEALRHLATATGRAPARVLLDALPSHPPAFDPMLLELLASWALEHDVSPAAELMQAATPADVGAMNRVLAVYAAKKDEAAPMVTASDVAARREALTALAELAPLSEEALRKGLQDPVPAHRLKAARGLARGERRTLAAMVTARLEGEKPASEDELRALLSLLGDVGEQGCVEAGLLAFRGARPALRELGLRTAATCDFAAVENEIDAAIESPEPAVRAAGFAALGFAPKTLGAKLPPLLDRGLGDPDPGCRRAACEAVAQQRWRLGLPKVTPLAADPDPVVRREALRALVALDAPNLEGKLVQALESDPAAPVRAAAAEALGLFTSPRVLRALGQAARSDGNADVKLVAGQTLRRLGLQESPP